MRKCLFLTLLMLGCGMLYAQQRPSDFNRITLQSALQQFSTTRNAAGLGLFQPASGSKTQIVPFYQTGDFHLAQQGSSDAGFEFSTLRYDSFSDRLFMRGSFFYAQDKESGRKWSDVRDPWFSIPYIYGSSVAKDYDTHHCGLTFDLYTAPLSNGISWGIRTVYEVYDISGNRDPRPRTGSLDYEIVPSVLFSFGRHRLGVDAGYGFTKEKLIGLTTIQSYPNLYYYKMSGLDHVDGAIAAYSGFKRQFVGDRVLGDISYGYAGPDLRIMASTGVEYLKENAYGDRMQSPGSWNYLEYTAQADLQLTRPGKMHRWHLSAAYKDAGADEYLQELNSTKDPVTGATTETWETLYEYTNRYMLKKWDASLDYTLFGGCAGETYRWSARGGIGYSGFLKEIFLPYSEFGTSGLTVSAGGSFRLMEHQGHKLDLSALAMGYLPGETTQNLQYDNLYTQEVLVPDAAYYAKGRASLQADLTWLFPLRLGKAGEANGYVRLSGGYCQAFPAGNLSNISLSVGLFTL